MFVLFVWTKWPLSLEIKLDLRQQAMLAMYLEQVPGSHRQQDIAHRQVSRLAEKDGMECSGCPLLPAKMSNGFA